MPKASSDSSNTGPKHFDIAKPGKTAPSASARPIIVSHGPMMADPMVKKPTAPEVPSTATPATPLPSPPKKVIISPSSGSTLLKSKPTSSAKSAAATTDDVQPVTVTMNSNRTVAELAAEAEALSSDSETISEEVTKEAPGINLSSQEDASNTKTPAITPEAPAPTSKTSPAPEEPSSTTPTDSTSPAESTYSATPVDGTSSQEGVVDAMAQQAVAKKEDAKLAQERAEFEEKMTKLVQAETYFVPIGAQARKRHARTILSVIVLLLLLAAVGTNFALDAGMLKLDGISPLTDVISD